MNATETNDTEIKEIMQTLMNKGAKGFPSVVARMYNLAMQVEQELSKQGVSVTLPEF